MTFPNFKNKHAEDALFNPKDFLKYLKKIGKYPSFKAPKRVIFCYSKSFFNYILAQHEVTKIEGFREMYILDDSNGQIAVAGRFGIGAPAVITLMEELIAFGVKEFISIGTAGALQKYLKIGNLVVCDRAIRDEGVSHHYAKSSKYSYASKILTANIKTALENIGEKYSIGTSWTIDAPYRETVEEARQYQKEGVATVEMELSALFAVAEYRKVEMGTILTISDSLADLKWKPQFHHKDTSRGLETLYKVALGVEYVKIKPNRDVTLNYKRNNK